MSFSTDPLKEPSSSPIDTGRIIVAVLLIIGLLWLCRNTVGNRGEDVVQSTVAPRATSRPAATRQPTRPDVAYTMQDSEEYGTLNDRGLKFWVIVPEGVTSGEMLEIAEYETNRNKAGYEGLTFFMYVGREPGEDGNWVADSFFEWSADTNTVRKCNGPC